MVMMEKPVIYLFLKGHSPGTLIRTYLRSCQVFNPVLAKPMYRNYYYKEFDTNQDLPLL